MPSWVETTVISHCEGVLPESIVLLDRLAIPGIDLVVLCPVPVDSEGFTSLDAAPINSHSKISVDVGFATTSGREPAVPAKR